MEERQEKAALAFLLRRPSLFLIRGFRPGAEHHCTRQRFDFMWRVQTQTNHAWLYHKFSATWSVL